MYRKQVCFPPIYRKSILSVSIILFCVNFCFSQKQLTKKEKLTDFEYLYQELKASYPYFGINKRAYKTDWLAKKSEYIEAIKKTKDDKAFFNVFNDIMNDLHNGHTDAYPTIIYSYFYDAYKQAVAQHPIYESHVKELEKTDSIRSKYWEDINHELFFSDTNVENTAVESTNNTYENIDITFIDSLKTASIHVKSFSYDYLDQDADTLKYFFNKAQAYENIIIDIQGNDGGSTEYWIQNMLPHLINDTISTPVVYAFKNSDRLRKFKPNYFENMITYDEIGLPNTPEELKNGSYLFRRDDMTIVPSEDSQKYLGKVYLLVDNVVFSSSETLAFFCKSTKFATVVGEKTSGDGVGTDPLLLTLPNSGIVIRFTGEMGLNPDGSANDETKTIPDISIEATDMKERRKKLLSHIQHKK
ncbi:S41 family peptidase [uncultured Kordia sp.]|uniref:S41 family peptidase n=1 Tax=uncultured Kordia sp. TaxID=507699 RepID=UPI002608B155|nr:S41 family peptidase [uncultured Kordia sp.]